jgi:hypothetical protein
MNYYGFITTPPSLSFRIRFGSETKSCPDKKIPNEAARRSLKASFRKSKKNLPLLGILKTTWAREILLLF